MMKRKFKINAGFTLIELLVVIVILGILITIGLVSFSFTQVKTRDGQRKSDLEQIGRALETYYNDYGSYPSASDGKITFGTTVFEWDSPLIDAKQTMYMKKLPSDPTDNPPFCYKSSGSAYQIYARLENSQDPKISGPYTCNGVNTYNYGTASTNSNL